MRSSIFATFVLLVVIVPGCDQASNHTRQGVSGQGLGRQQPTATGSMASITASNAELRAEQKQERAQMEFMQLREKYRQLVTAGLVDLDRKVLILEGKEKYSRGAAKSAMQMSLTQIRADRYAFMSDYKSLDTASSGTWEATKARLDKEWTALSELVDRS